MAVWSYLSWAVPPLPALPSFLNLSLPPKLQKRFVSYLLKRSLGRFVKGSGLDVESVEGQISEGRLTLEKLELDVDAINEVLVSDIPLTVQSGQINGTLVQIPIRNLWSDSLILGISSISLELSINCPSTNTPQSHPTHSHIHDLAASVTSVAQEFLSSEVDAYEGADLARTIRESLVSSPNTRDAPLDEDMDDNPFGSPQSTESDQIAPGGFPFTSATTGSNAGSLPNSSVLAGLVERVLARLQVRVGEINIRIHFQDGESTGAAWFDFKIDHITYMNEMDDKETTGATEGSSTSRMIRWATVSLQMTEELQEDAAAVRPKDLQHRRDRSRSQSRTPTPSASSFHSLSPKRSKQGMRSDSDSSTSDSDIDPAAEIMMSQAIADLRESQVLPQFDAIPDMSPEEEAAPTFTAASVTNSPDDEGFLSLYASAMEGTITGGDPKVALLPARNATPPGVSRAAAGFGGTAAPADVPLPASVSAIPGRPPSLAKHRSASLFAISQESSIRMSPGTQTNIQVQVGLCATLVAQWQFRTLLNVAQALSNRRNMPADQEEEDMTNTSPPISIKLEMPEIILAVAQIPDCQGTAATSWVWQPSESPGVDIFRLHVLGLVAFMDKLEPSLSSTDPPHLSFEVAKLSVDEVLSSALRLSQTNRIISFGHSHPTHSKEQSVQGSTTDHATRQLWSMEDWPSIPCQELLANSDGAEKLLNPIDCALRISYLKENYRWSIDASPFMLCLDVSMMDKLQPLFAGLNNAGVKTSAASPESAQPHGAKAPLVEEAASPSASHGPNSPHARLIGLHCPSFRLVFRWPTRHHINPVACIALTHLRFSKASKGDLMGGSFEQMLLMICPTNDMDCRTILAISSLKLEKEEATPAAAALLPHFTLGTSPTQGINCDLQVPSLQCNLDKSSVDALQYFADDLSRWAARHQEFSIKQGDSTFIHGSQQSPTPITIRLNVTEVDVFMRILTTTPDEPFKRLVCSLSDSETTVTMGGSNDVRKMGITLSIDNATVAHCLGAQRTPLLYRQTRQLPMGLSKPAIVARFNSIEDQRSSRKEAGIKLELTSIACVATPSLFWISDLASLFKSPPGIFENVEPSEVTKLSINLKDALVILPASQTPGALLVRLDGFSAATELLADADRNTYKISSDSVGLFQSDQPLETLREILERLHVVNAVADSSVDVCSVIALKDAALVISVCPQNRLAGNHIGLDVGAVQVAACADAISSLGGLVDDIASFWAGGPDQLEQSATQSSPLAKGLDLLASLDETAFTKHAHVLSDAEVILDDIPTNEIYLQRYDSGGQARHQESTVSEDSPFGELPHPVVPTTENDSSQVRILYHGPVRLSPSYWAEHQPLSKPDERLQLSLDFRFDEIQILLHDGYDWSTTRKTIEAEIKAIRRRLQKLRQILASGQTPDESVEVTRTWLYESILIGLPEEELGDDAEALLAAIDNQLETLDADTASIAPSGPATSRRGDSTRSSPRPARRRRKLERSTRPQIEIKLAGFEVSHRVAVAGVRDRAKTSIASVNMEILDHIKTSTWKKFLAPMALSQGQVAETDVKMVQVHLTKVIAEEHGKQQEEYRLKVEVQPLRLHIDQDALDFMKRFFAFQNHAESMKGASPGSGKQSAYLQHVEILPVHIKMDYKPKRVDMRALRAGKTMELMNFFHFDGSEMTLRRVLLSGVTGWSTLYDALNDIWSPDVRSNQLADVLAGVTPMRSVVNVGSGVADLILLPIENYRQDGHISRGLQKGAKSFAMSTALEALRLGANLATGTQVILEKAEHALGGKFEESFPGGDLGDVGVDGEQSIILAPTSKYAQQPESFKEGLSAAYRSLSSNFTQAAQTILAVPMEVHERSENGTVRAVVRAIPVAFLKSGIGATEAVSKALFGMRNQLDPSVTAELSDKYK